MILRKDHKKNEYETYKNLKSKKEKNDYLTKLIREDKDIRFDLLSKVGLDNMPSIFESGSIDFKDLLKKKKKSLNRQKLFTILTQILIMILVLGVVVIMMMVSMVMIMNESIVLLDRAK